MLAWLPSSQLPVAWCDVRPSETVIGQEGVSALTVIGLPLLVTRPAVPPDLVPSFPILVFFDFFSTVVWLRVDLDGPSFALAAVSAEIQLVLLRSG